MSLSSSAEQARAQAAGDEMVRIAQDLLPPGADEGPMQAAVDLANELAAVALLGLNEKVGVYMPSAFHGIGTAIGFYRSQVPPDQVSLFTATIASGINAGMEFGREAFEPQGHA